MLIIVGWRTHENWYQRYIFELFPLYFFYKIESRTELKVMTRSDWLSKRGYLACMKGYCWRESRANIVAIVKTKIQLVLGRKHLGNKRIRMSAKDRIEIEIVRKFEEATHTLCALVRFTKIENVSFCSGGLSYAIQEKFTAWRMNSTLNVTWKTAIALIGFSREI